MFEAPAGAQIKHASRGAAAAELLAAPEAVRVFGRSGVSKPRSERSGRLPALELHRRRA